VKESLDLITNPIIIYRSEDEKIEIETSINSVKANVVIKKHADLEELIMDI
jgi:hypothetical protein